MTAIYLAYVRVPKTKLADFNGCHRPPALLLSYFYLPALFETASKLNHRSWCLDSGAFSAFTRGKPIKNADFIAFVRNEVPRCKIGPPEMIFGLDVIGDWRASVKNCEEAWAADIQCVPTWHQGEPWDVLKGLAKDYPKIAIGGLVGSSPKGKYNLLARCYDLIWPCLAHGFGVTACKAIDEFPLDTVDSTTWSNPLRFGYYPRAAGGSAKMRTSYANASLRPEVEFYLRKERDLEKRWGLALAPHRRKYRETLKPTPYQAIPADV